MAYLPRCIVALILVCAAAVAAAQERPERREPPKDAGPGILHLLPADAVSDHSITTARGAIAYTATAGTLALYDQSGTQSASVFYTAYVAKDAPPNRPVTFVFNGGPGAASAFLHLGVVGPRLLDLGPGGRDVATAQLVDNPDTWLGFTDLVLIDPIGTGWSRTAKPDDAKGFWGVRRDADSIAKVIALYVAHNNRSGSPKYLFGESYGGFRAVKVARSLQRDQGIVIAGIVMLSPLLDGTLTFGGDRLALGAALQLPSLAAAELERKNAFTPAALAEAERFAMTDYLAALAGPALQGDKAKAFYQRVANLTGLPADSVAQSRGFISDDYLKRFRAADHKVVSLYDATFAVDDPFPEQRSTRGGDPILDGVSRAYSGAFAAYARNELGFKTEITYTLLAGDISGHWDWEHGGRYNARSDDDIRLLLSFTPTFRLLIAHGYSDLVTPYGATRYIVDHLPQIGAPNRVQLKLYRGGHMLYLDPASRKAFTADAAAFYRAAE
jgi:carboxypeptidase C (cathepsin A)